MQYFELTMEKNMSKRPQNNEPKTPASTNSSRSEDEFSPYFPCLTQENRDDVDVLWDYNSPRESKPRTAIVRKSKKRLDLQQHSPKVAIKRHLSNNNDQIKQDFCKLREELRALKAEIARPDHESLVLSPREEEAFKDISEEPHIKDDVESVFDDDMDEKLIMFSQQVELEIERAEGGFSGSSGLAQNLKSNARNSDTFNDSLVVDDSVFEQLTQVADIKQSVSENNVQCSSILQSVSRKVEWHRTHSFETHTKAELSKDILLEIERKRLEAKAKLHAKKRCIPTTSPEITDSLLRCSSKEIERKRLEAKAKLEAKRQQELIEKKKQEAVKRREEVQRKQVEQVKNLLSGRF
ncbi:inner centromere protein-like isoform X3 [Euwallacea fornicatus]|uniref:inner centromere protein-like isoform X3 n=1 Tax=Euwallacea fornicatus TaxID=995702 RepID=UPI00338F5AD9